MRFLIGSGAAYVILSVIGEGEPEIAKALAFALATTVILGDGGGVLSYLNSSKNETDTTKKAVSDDVAPVASSAEDYPAVTGPFTPPTSPTLLEQFQEDSDYGYSGSLDKIQPQQFRPDRVGFIPGY